MSWLDFKLGLRMLVRYPMLTIVGGLAAAVAIGVGTATFEVISRVMSPALPFADGDRIVGVNWWDRADSVRRPPSSADFHRWRNRLNTVEHVGAFRIVQRNLSIDNQPGEPAEAAEISTSAFVVTAVPPLLGRTLIEADEAAGAPPVLVLSHDLWQRRFDADPRVVGRTVRYGSVQATVIGVMPEGFAFPISQTLWTQLRPSDLPDEHDRAVPLRLFARLTPGSSIDNAQAELSTDAYENRQVRVEPFAESVFAIPPDAFVRAGIHSINAFAALFLVLVCGNVALLMFARAATREREIVVRRALGAHRIRIVMQLFAEALVLNVLAGLLGLAATNFALKSVLNALSTEGDRLPFWVLGGLTSTTVAYAALLTLLASIVAGVLPALKITRTTLEAGLRRGSAGAGGVRMGGLWTGVIVGQVAVSVLFTAVSYVAVRQASGIAAVEPAFPSHEYLAVQLEMDGDRERYDSTVRAFDQRLAAEPRVAGVTIADRLPLMPTTGGDIELDDAQPDATTPRREHFVITSTVDLDFFDVFKAPALAGRTFTALDTGAGANTVIVNRLFVERMLAGRDPIGRRLRFTPRPPATTEPGPWLEIVGVVRDLVPDPKAPLNLDNPAKPLLYRALGPSPRSASPLHLAVHVRGDAATLVPTLRRLASEVNPELRLTAIQPLHEAGGSDARAWQSIASTILGLSTLALVLSLAGIYAVTSFTASRRTREVAVRVALGAPAARVVQTVFARPIAQVVTGITLGCILFGSLVALSLSSSPEGFSALGKHVVVLFMYGAAMTAVCALACAGPVLRVLRVQPVEVLRDEG